MLNFNPQDRLQVQQAAKSFVVSVQKARFEAISKNLFAGVRVTGSSFQIFLDTDPAGAPDRTYSAGDQIVEEVAIGSGSYPLVSLVSDSGREVVFTPRGTPLRCDQRNLYLLLNTWELLFEGQSVVAGSRQIGAGVAVPGSDASASRAPSFKSKRGVTILEL